MKPNFFNSMNRARKLVRAGNLVQATSLVRQALGTLVPPPAAPRKAPARPAAAPKRPVAAEVPRRPSTPTEMPTAPQADDAAGEFVAGQIAGIGGFGSYKVFVPARRGDSALSLVVMLHGCTQDPDDFAAGTAMNRRAGEEGFFVLYPLQPKSANPSGCWNWFRREDQRRDGGEPALIAAMTRAVIAQYGLDPHRVAVAGLSAGGAMAAIVGAAYPDLFAAVGVHSGLPIGAARNIPDALSVMRTGAVRGSSFGPGREGREPFVPTIVFHGDADRTVHPDNGVGVVDAAIAARASAAAGLVAPVVVDGTTSGRRYTRARYTAADGAPLVEHWIVHGAGHAWSGGDPHGSHADRKGPSATDEMLRFFREAIARATPA